MSENFEWRIRQRSRARAAVQRAGNGEELLLIGDVRSFCHPELADFIRTQIHMFGMTDVGVGTYNYFVGLKAQPTKLLDNELVISVRKHAHIAVDSVDQV